MTMPYKTDAHYAKARRKRNTRFNQTEYTYRRFLVEVFVGWFVFSAPIFLWFILWFIVYSMGV